jgi:hypothetical protein
MGVAKAANHSKHEYQEIEQQNDLQWQTLYGHSLQSIWSFFVNFCWLLLNFAQFCTFKVARGNGGTSGWGSYYSLPYRDAMSYFVCQIGWSISYWFQGTHEQLEAHDEDDRHRIVGGHKPQLLVRHPDVVDHRDDQVAQRQRGLPALLVEELPASRGAGNRQPQGATGFAGLVGRVESLYVVLFLPPAAACVTYLSIYRVHRTGGPCRICLCWAVLAAGGSVRDLPVYLSIGFTGLVGRVASVYVVLFLPLAAACVTCLPIYQ